MKFNFVAILILCFGLCSAVSICIDNEPPSAPGNLSVSGSVGNILVNWAEAEDAPDCSGIAEYVILRDGVEIGRVSGNVLSFIDNDSLRVGSYLYYVYAIDLGSGNADGNEGASVVNEISVGDGGVVRSGGSGSFTCVSDWVCGDWSECVDGEMRRVCEDKRRCGTDYLRPVESMSCGEEDVEERFLNMEDEVVAPETGGFVSAVTGAVIGGGMGSVAAGIVLLILSIAGLVFIVRRKRRL